MTTGPADILGLEAGRLRKGAPADLVLFDHEDGYEEGKIAIRETIVRGRRVHSRDRGG